jgi:hypothetical protein
VQKGFIGRGSLQVKPRSITADIATNCGVTHIGSGATRAPGGFEKSNQLLKGAKPGIERTDV